MATFSVHRISSVGEQEYKQEASSPAKALRRFLESQTMWIGTGISFHSIGLPISSSSSPGTQTAIESKEQTHNDSKRFSLADATIEQTEVTCQNFGHLQRTKTYLASVATC